MATVKNLYAWLHSLIEARRAELVKLEQALAVLQEFDRPVQHKRAVATMTQLRKKVGPAKSKKQSSAAKAPREGRFPGNGTLAARILTSLEEAGEAIPLRDLHARVVKHGWSTSSKNPISVLSVETRKLVDRGRVTTVGPQRDRRYMVLTRRHFEEAHSV